MTLLPCLSIRQPWAFACIYSGKTHENRTWATKYRGPLAVHAAMAFDTNVPEDWIDFILRCAIARGMEPAALPASETIARGGIIGTVDLIDCVTESDSPWFFGPYGFVLANPRPCKFVPMKGRLGLFNIDANLIEREA